MSRTIQLTNDQWQQIVADADANEMLTVEEAERIGTKLAEKKNLPLFGEEKEKIVFIKIVKKIDQTLYKVLPNELYATIRDVEGGIDDDEAREISRRLTKYINKEIDIPYLPEILEKAIIKMALDIIIDAMRKGKKL